METKLDETSSAIQILRGVELADRYMELKSKLFNRLPHPVFCSSSQLLLLRLRISYIKEVTALGVCTPFPEEVLFSAINTEDLYEKTRKAGWIKSNWNHASEEGTPADDAGDVSSEEGFIPPPVPFSGEHEYYFEEWSALVPLQDEDENQPQTLAV